MLLDSLEPHLAFCEFIAEQEGVVDFERPTEAEFKALIANGANVSPMVNFFKAAGFPDDAAERATARYEREFMASHAPAPFEGVAALMERLARRGIALGVVTANTRENVEPALGEALAFVPQADRHFFESGRGYRPKSEWLREAAARHGLNPSRCVYVGDQPGDEVAALAAGWSFVPVSHGWGFADRAAEPWTALSAKDIERAIEARAAANAAKNHESNR